MERFWIYLDNKVQGPVDIPGLRKFPGFNLLTQVCQEGQESWRMADDVIEIKSYFSSPPRGSSLTAEAQPELPIAEKMQPEIPVSLNAAVPELDSVPTPAVLGNLTMKPAPASNGAEPAVVEPKQGLRVSCQICGYKNPRDVGVCMKCGTPIKVEAPKADGPVPLRQAAESPEPVVQIPQPVGRVTDPASLPMEASANPTVEIPVARILIILLSISVGISLFFMGHQMWKKRQAAKAAKIAAAKAALLPPVIAPAVPRVHKTHAHHHPRAVAMALPGISSPGTKKEETPPAETATAEPAQAEEPLVPVKKTRKSKEHDVAEVFPTEKETTQAPYGVLNEAYPEKHRTAAPVDSKYATKRHADHNLWPGREDEAIQLAQRQRIYGGQRTILRNVEILMQILRDREYTTAFESGKRLYLLNDVDWSATQLDASTYEVHLIFSGGKEADGSARVPLRFAFKVDLEQRTVEPSGTGGSQVNTLRAFFDESRIPPEERRAVAKDTEELVVAAQPDASPLALDTIARHFSATYSASALERVATAFNLTNLEKKIRYQKEPENEVLPAENSGEKPHVLAPRVKAPVVSSMSGNIEYTMEKLEGRERLLTATAPSSATPARLWEVLTGYDRMVQFVPDLLVSDREGQDGPAVIVHTVSLTHLLFFVFKINLHLRILEHPQQHRMEFERIAGDFEKFSGYAEITTDLNGKSTLNLHVNMAPKGYLPNWMLRDMARHFLIPILDAVRSRAEAN